MRVTESGPTGELPLGASHGARGASRAATAPAHPTDHEKKEGPSPFARILKGLGHEVDRGERVVRSALGAGGAGAELGTGQLLALQAGVYRYSEAVDLSAKLVDRASSGVKTVVQGQ
ncbi:MAG: hypothetical protein KC657_02365 [Myxococcales bacterium]|nr:hypothetical protein [Myxococcales bacterium]